MLTSILRNGEIMWQGPIGLSRDAWDTITVEDACGIIVAYTPRRVCNYCISLNQTHFGLPAIEVRFVGYFSHCAFYLPEETKKIVIHNSLVPVNVHRSHQSLDIIPIGEGILYYQSTKYCVFNIIGSDFRWFHLRLASPSKVRFNGEEIILSPNSSLYGILIIRLAPGVFVYNDGSDWIPHPRQYHWVNGQYPMEQCHRISNLPPLIIDTVLRFSIGSMPGNFYKKYPVKCFHINRFKSTMLYNHRRIWFVSRS